MAKGLRVLGFQEFTADQARIFQDLVQLGQALEEQERRAKSFRGGMFWKSSAGKQYLYRSLDRKGHTKSLGPRNAATEAQYNAFHEGKARAEAGLREIRNRLSEYALYAKAARINRLPRVVARVAAGLNKADLGNRTLLVGTNCLFAYEALAGGRVLSDAVSTQDLDILHDSRVRAEIVGHDLAELIAVVRAADKSFEVSSSQPFRLINSRGYMVDVITPQQPFAPLKVGRSALEPAEIEGLEWLISSPRQDVMVIGEDGHPVSLHVPAPDSFAAHKLWLSERPARPAMQRRRDRLQAAMVARLARRGAIRDEIEESLRSFPRDVRTRYLALRTRELSRDGDGLA